VNILQRINHQIKHRLVKPIARSYGLLAREPNTEAYLDQLNKHSEFLLDNRIIADQRESVFLDDGKDLTLSVKGMENVLSGIELSGKKVLEVGPKYGIHSKFIAEKYCPSEIVFADFESDSKLHDPWKNTIKCNNRWVYGDIRHLADQLKGEQFDFIFFLGVLYHTVYHLPVLSSLNRLLKPGGKMLLESSYDSMPGSYLQIKFHYTQRAKAVPTKDALRVQLAFTGWRRVNHFVNYRPNSSELLFLCEKTDEIMFPDHDTCNIVVPHK